MSDCRKEIIEFLKQSNYIEGEYDDIALNSAVEAWDYLIKQDELNKENILKTHNILMRELNPRIAGKLRCVNVRVGSRVCPVWKDVDILFESWLLYAKEFDDAIKNPIIDLNPYEDVEGLEIKNQHVQFEKIHPFEDGNGRIGRIIMNWQRIKAGLPILIIYEKDRFEYYKWFKD
jgi:Fic family protein